jgi:hypothetical protein
MRISSTYEYNHKWLALWCIPLAVLLTGCVKMDIALTVNKDTTMSGTVVLALADSIAALDSSGSSSGTSGTGGLDNLVDKKAKGVTVSKYHQGGFTGEKVTFDHSPLKSFSSTSKKDGSFAIDIKGNKAFISGAMDLSSTCTQTSDSLSADDALTKAMMASAQFRISVTFPGKISKSTGEISQDRRTVTWNPAFGEKTDLATTVELDSPVNFIPWAIGGLLFIALVIWLIILNRRKKPPEASVVDTATPIIEGEETDDSNQELGSA